MIATLKGQLVTAKLWAPIHEIESTALDQLKRIASLPWVAHLAVMPDVHFGKGATVGSVIGMRGAISPAAVGVDIGCGMGAIKTNLTAKDLPESLKQLRTDIEACIPVGIAAHKQSVKLTGSKDALALSNDVKALYEDFKDLDRIAHEFQARSSLQLGTLGGGNHFIELCLDTDQNVWMMLHSGSRYIGNVLAKVHMARAMDLGHNAKLPDKELSVFLAGTREMQEYRRDLYWAQRYAMLNRRVMFELYKGTMRQHFPQVTFGDPVLCHHNYVAEEQHFGEELVVTRKGAISAAKGQLGIIPGSMGAKSFIVRGLGNEEALTSASHGAGRKMSRGQAKRTFTQADVEAQTLGVECRKDSAVTDEIPGAYKDILQVMANQADLVEIVAELKQVLCVKG